LFVVFTLLGHVQFILRRQVINFRMLPLGSRLIGPRPPVVD
jgi:hypothetical protein